MEAHCEARWFRGVFFSGRLFQLFIPLTFFALAGCNEDRPGQSDATKQISAFENAKLTESNSNTTTGLFGSDTSTLCLRASSEWLPKIVYDAIGSVEYVNGYVKDANNFIVLAKIHYIAAVSNADVRDALETAIAKHPFDNDDCKRELLGYVKSIFGHEKSVGETDDSDSAAAIKYRFLKNEKGWELQGEEQ